MQNQPSPVRLLFVGNSYTFRNDLPGLIAQMAPVAVETHMIVAGGASLRQHINNGSVAEALDSSAWDWVILQEQSTLPIKNPTRFAANVRELHETVTRHSARTALYQTWARQQAPETQENLSKEYEVLAADIGALLVPVGVAWQKVRLEHPEMPLFDADGSHPTAMGSYLAACVFVEAIWGQTPRFLTGVIETADATRLQQAAHYAAQQAKT